MIRDKSAAFWFLVSIRSTDRLGPKPMASFSSSYSLSTKKFQAKIRKKKQNNNRKEGQHHMLFSSRRLRCACSCVSKICFFFFSRHAAFEIDEDSSTLMLGECDKNCDFGTTGEQNNLDRYKAGSLVLNGAQSLISPLN